MNGADYLLGAEALARHGQRVALICGAEKITYADLAARVRRAAGALAALGVEPGDRVMLLMRDTPDLAAAWLGCLWCGAVAIALNSQLAEDDYRFVRSDSGARLAIVEDVFAARLTGFVQALTRERRIAIAGSAPTGVPNWSEALQGAAPDSPPFAANPEDAAFWLYSSGTTGRPKGIIHTHKDVLPAGQTLRETIALQPGDKVIATSSLFFAYGLENGLLGPLSIGAASVLCADWSDVEHVCALVAEHQPTGFFSVPSFYRRLLALGAQALVPFRPVRLLLRRRRTPSRVHGRAMAERRGTRDSLGLRHVRDVLRRHRYAGRHLERQAYRQAASWRRDEARGAGGPPGGDR